MRENYQSSGGLQTSVRFAVAGLCLTLCTAEGAQFQFGTLIRAGLAGPSDWEVGVGDTAGAPAATASLNAHWQGTPAITNDRLLEVEYLKATNTMNVRLHNNASSGSGFVQASFQPTGGAAVPLDATWTLPAISFFARAAAGPTFATSITLANITLSGVFGAINIIQPVGTTTLTASRAANGPTVTVAENTDIVFQGDSTGSWRLQGNVRMGNFSGPNGPTGDNVTIGISGIADSAVPEPASIGFTLVGLSLMMGWVRRKKATSSRSA